MNDVTAARSYVAPAPAAQQGVGSAGRPPAAGVAQGSLGSNNDAPVTGIRGVVGKIKEGVAWRFSEARDYFDQFGLSDELKGRPKDKGFITPEFADSLEQRVVRLRLLQSGDPVASARLEATEFSLKLLTAKAKEQGGLTSNEAAALIHQFKDLVVLRSDGVVASLSDGKALESQKNVQSFGLATRTPYFREATARLEMQYDVKTGAPRTVDSGAIDFTYYAVGANLNKASAQPLAQGSRPDSFSGSQGVLTGVIAEEVQAAFEGIQDLCYFIHDNTVKDILRKTERGIENLPKNVHAFLFALGTVLRNSPELVARLRTLPAQDQAKILTSMVVQLAKIVLVTKGAAAGVKAAAGAAEGSAETLAQLMNLGKWVPGAGAAGGGTATAQFVFVASAEAVEKLKAAGYTAQEIASILAQTSVSIPQMGGAASQAAAMGSDPALGGNLMARIGESSPSGGPKPPKPPGWLTEVTNHSKSSTRWIHVRESNGIERPIPLKPGETRTFNATERVVEIPEDVTQKYIAPTNTPTGTPTPTLSHNFGRTGPSNTPIEPSVPKGSPTFKRRPPRIGGEPDLVVRNVTSRHVEIKVDGKTQTLAPKGVTTVKGSQSFSSTDMGSLDIVVQKAPVVYPSGSNIRNMATVVTPSIRNQPTVVTRALK